MKILLRSLVLLCGFGFAMLQANAQNGGVGINEVEQTSETELQIIPNSNAKHLSIIGVPEGSTISIFDSQGRLVISKPSSGDRESFSTSFWPSGIYIVNVYSKSQFESKKVMIF